MSGFGILMIIFASIVLLVGLYMYTGHKLGIFEYRMIVSIFIFILGIIGIIFNFE